MFIPIRSFSKIQKSIDFSIFEYRQGNIRERRSVDLMQWQSALNLLNQFYPEKNQRDKISVTSSDRRSLPGPINIEQLPAILASRHVQRYPYSPQNDPSVMYVNTHHLSSRQIILFSLSFVF